MEQINKVELQGCISQVRINTVNNSHTRVANFTLCVEHAYTTRKGEAFVDTTWFNCVLWEQRAGQLDSIVKGGMAHVEGRLRQRRYTATDGTERSVLEVVVSDYKSVGVRTAEDGKDELDF